MNKRLFKRFAAMNASRSFGEKGTFSPFFEVAMEFYVIKEEYINYLKEYEMLNRGITKVPDVKYETQTKFALGIILEVEKIPYYVMISSFCKKQEANILIRIKGDKKEVKGSLRFNYMIPVPSHCVTRLDFETIENKKYKNLIEKEYRFCKKNKEMIMEKAVRIYDLVVNMKKKNLIDNSCDFKLLEEAYKKYNICTD